MTARSTPLIWVLRTVPLVLATALALLGLPLPGTGDVGQFLRWTTKIMDWGLVDGYRGGNNPYPPFSALLLAGAGRWAQATGMTPHASLKLLLLVMLLLSTAIALAWTRSLLFAGLLQLSLVLSVTLGYLDVFFLPPLLLSLWALQRERLVLASLMFGVTVMVKFQPAVLTPVLLIHVLGPSRDASAGGAGAGGAPAGSRARRLLAAVLPALLVALATLAVFGLPMLDKLRRVTMDWFLSGNAFNLDWIATWLMHVFRPDWYGGLDPSGVCPMISEIDPVYLWPSKLLFLAVYVVLLATYWRRAKTFPSLLLHATLVFLAAWLFSAGMHENHIFVGQILAMLLGFFDRRHLGTAWIWAVAANLNLLLTVGIRGHEVHPVRVVGGLDIGLLISVLNLAAFAVLVARSRRA